MAVEKIYTYESISTQFYYIVSLSLLYLCLAHALQNILNYMYLNTINKQEGRYEDIYNGTLGGDFGL